jgi:flavodoxin
MWRTKVLLNDVDEDNIPVDDYDSYDDADEASVPFDEYLKLTKSYVYRTDPTYQSTPTPEIMEYIRDNKNQKIGVMYAFREDDTVYSGWSLCSKRDTFDRELGQRIARARARKVCNSERLSIIDDIPYSIKDRFLDFIERRCVTYFKDANYFKF